MSLHNVKYFIQKFEAIPEDKWCTKRYTKDDTHCALGHCGCLAAGEPGGPLLTEEAIALKTLFNGIVDINDGRFFEYLGPTPKQRVLKALYDLRDTLIDV